MGKKLALSVQESKRIYLSQTDVPSYSLAEAVRVPQAIADNYGKNPTKPLRVAEAMNMQPGSSTFRMLCGASIAYGLTEGGYNSEQISLALLGRRIVAPTTEGDDAKSRREALLRPRVIKEFLTKYDDSKLPGDSIARNVLEEMGVPANRTQSVYELIRDGAREVGFLRDVKGSTYVDLDGASNDAPATDVEESIADEQSEIKIPSAVVVPIGGTAPVKDRVFITHGRNKEIVNQLKELLTFGNFKPIVAVEQETASKPVPEKVLDEMRSCNAAIIHVGAELKLLDPDGKEHKMLNQNVLIEIGAAMALYSKRFILLVEKGVNLPSNLQGLYEVRYEGDKLDYEATMRLLKAFNDFRA